MRLGCFAVRRGQATRRADVNYNLLTDEVERRLAHPRYGLDTVGSLEVILQYGCSQRATEEPIGHPILRMNNLQANGWNLSDLKYVTVSDKEFSRWRLEPGDIVFNRTNSKELVGKCEVFREDGDWLFASYLMRLRVDSKRALPEFVSAFLNTRAGRVQIDRESRQIIGMSNINAEEIRTLRVPLPDPPKQASLMAPLDAARAALRRQLKEADDLLKGLDGFVLDALNLELPQPHGEHSTYAVRASDVHAARKLHPQYFHPDRVNAIRAVQTKYKKDRSATLSGVADFIRNQKKVEPGDDYLGLANVQPNTGERVESTEEDGQGSCFTYLDGDILFARLRPYLNKVYRAESGGVCSTEFHVIRLRKDDGKQPRLIPDYLAAVLRSSVVLLQTRHMMTGNTHPRLANEDVVNLVVPVPDRDIQEKVAAEVARRREAARRLRSDAARMWEEAKKRFEEELLGPYKPGNGGAS